jgi:Flp pilus assembly protein TadB
MKYIVFTIVVVFIACTYLPVENIQTEQQINSQLVLSSTQITDDILNIKSNPDKSMYAYRGMAKEEWKSQQRQDNDKCSNGNILFIALLLFLLI